MRAFAALVLVALLAGCGKDNPPPAPPSPPTPGVPAPPTGGNTAPPPGDLNNPPLNGQPAAASPYEWGWLGLNLADPPDEVLKLANLKSGGAIVGGIVDGSPATEVLKVGDVLVKADDQPIDSIPAFLARVRTLKGGTEIHFTLFRDGKESKIVVKVTVQKAKDLLTKAMSSAVAWLKQQQRPADGAWEYPHPSRVQGAALGRPHSAVTALVLAALAGVPADMRSQTDEVVAKGLGFLVNRIGAEGIVDSPPEEGIAYRSYTTALTAIALARHKGQGDKENLDRVLAGLRKAQMMETGDEKRNRKKSTLDWQYGSWNTYDGDVDVTQRSDISCASFVLQAFYEAGVSAEDPTIQKAYRFVKRSQNLAENGPPLPDYDDGGFAFNPRTGKAGFKQINPQLSRNFSYGSATADGLRCLMYCVRKKDDPRVGAAFAWLSRNYTVDSNPGFFRDPNGKIDVTMKPPAARFDQGIHFYFLHSMAQAFDLAAPAETVLAQGNTRYWAVDIVRKLSLMQGKDGTWTNAIELMNEDDPNVSTALGLLTLDVLASHIK